MPQIVSAVQFFSSPRVWGLGLDTHIVTTLLHIAANLLYRLSQQDHYDYNYYLFQTKLLYTLSSQHVSQR